MNHTPHPQLIVIVAHEAERERQARVFHPLQSLRQQVLALALHVLGDAQHLARLGAPAFWPGARNKLRGINRVRREDQRATTGTKRHGGSGRMRHLPLGKMGHQRVDQAGAQRHRLARWPGSHFGKHDHRHPVPAAIRQGAEHRHRVVHDADEIGLPSRHLSLCFWKIPVADTAVGGLQRREIHLPQDTAPGIGAGNDLHLRRQRLGEVLRKEVAIPRQPLGKQQDGGHAGRPPPTIQTCCARMMPGGFRAASTSFMLPARRPCKSSATYV